MTKRIYTQDELVEQLRNQIGFKRTSLDISRKYKISQSGLSEILNNKKGIGKDVCKKLGYEMVYRKIKQ